VCTQTIDARVQATSRARSFPSRFSESFQKLVVIRIDSPKQRSNPVPFSLDEVGGTDTPVTLQFPVTPQTGVSWGGGGTGGGSGAGPGGRGPEDEDEKKGESSKKDEVEGLEELEEEVVLEQDEGEQEDESSNEVGERSRGITDSHQQSPLPSALDTVAHLAHTNHQLVPDATYVHHDT
jgi:hypothetical protein